MVGGHRMRFMMLRRSTTSTTFLPHARDLRDRAISAFMYALKIAARIINLCGLAFLASIIVLNIPNQVVHLNASRSRSDVDLGLSLVACLLLLFGYALLSLHRLYDASKSSDAVGSAGAPSGFNLRPFQDEYIRLAGHLTEVERQELLAASLSLSRVKERTTEQVELNDTRIRRHVTRFLTVPPQMDGKIWYVPVQRHRKGRLVDELEVKVDGEYLESVRYISNVALSLLVIEDMFCDAVGASSPDLTPEQQETMRMIFNEVAHPRPRARTLQFSALTDRLIGGRATHPGSLSEQENRLLRALGYLADFYIIYVPLLVPAGQRSIRLGCKSSEGRRLFHRGASNQIGRAHV